MTFLDIDVDSAIEPRSVPADVEYELRIIEVKHGVDKNGNPYIMPRFEVINEVGAKDFTKFFGIPGQNDDPKKTNQKLWSLKAFCQAFSIDPKTDVTEWVGHSGWAILGVEATEHLIRLGHRRIGFVRGTTGSVPAAERLQGYLSALMMHDLPHDARLVAGDEFSAEAGLRAGLELLSLSPDVRPTGVFAANDAIALGVYQAARQLGLHVPDDLSVVGFDDSLLAPLVTPPLTTVNQPLEDMGAAAVRTLVDLSQSRPVTAGPIRLATSLAVRASTAPPAR